MLRTQMLLVFASLAGLVGASLGEEPAVGENAMNSQSAKLISDAFAKAKDQPAAERLQKFQAVAKVVQEKCPQNVLIAEQLQAATSGETLETALRASYDLLTFKLKQYPAYRLARTASAKNSGFFKLFAHITLNRIEMTAPVEMTYRVNDKQVPEQIDMAFIYGDTKLGKTGDKLGGVTVQDIPALTTVSIGLKGDNDRVKLAEVEQRLESWLTQHATDYERSGNLRVLGYNSPQVPTDSRYYEVELPIKKK